MIHVVSVMGLESSGLALAIDRYAGCIEAQGLECSPWQLSSVEHPELPNSRHVTLDAFTASIFPGDTVLWVGLAEEDSVFAAQCDRIRVASAMGAHNLLVPERTQRPDFAAYREAIRLCDQRVVTGLVHFNRRQQRIWSHWTSTPSEVCPPPIPNQLFALGDAIAASAPPLVSPSLVFTGRISRRKRVRELVDEWQAHFGDMQLHIFGRAFLPEEDESSFLHSLRDQDSIRLTWQPHFPTTTDILAVGRPAIAVSLSAQEFDGIALSEMLALRLPAVVAVNEGHLALAEESRSVFACPNLNDWRNTISLLASDPDWCMKLGARGHADMIAHRSIDVVGARLCAFLQFAGA